MVGRLVGQSWEGGRVETAGLGVRVYCMGRYVERDVCVERSIKVGRGKKG